MGDNPHIIGLTGSFGSGCSYIATNILQENGYTCYSLSDALKKLFTSETGKNPDTVPRHDLQDYGDEKREKEGSDFFAKITLEEILKEHKKSPEVKFVVDSIRNPSEIYVFRDCSTRFFLFGIYAGKDLRWQRVHEKYKDNQGDFDNDDKNDTGRDNETFGQRVQDCFYESDVVLKNDTNFDTPGNEAFNGFKAKITQYVDLVNNPLRKKRALKKEEALMAMAYAASQSSSCIKRKVGAVIVDESGNVISSGYNEVPRDEKPCEARFKECYRSKIWSEFFIKLKSKVPNVEGKEKDIMLHLKENFKILDLCRALHAEENAIINLAKNGNSVPLKECTIYTILFTIEFSRFQAA
ncbi:MAG: hypothetical protein ISS71_06120 [Phycisphaerae bacterium]|nr:hypothetical protein [Phycisphaerae bacterium]